MVKRTLHFSNPAYLSCKNQQLVVELRDDTSINSVRREKTIKTVPIEDVGIVILEHPQITFTIRLLELLLENKVSVITCNSKFMPNGMFLPLEGNSEQTERFRTQIESSIPLKKQLWQHTIKTKIENQGLVLEALGQNNERLKNLRNAVLSGDITNCEGQAASFYWGKIYGSNFTRTRDEDTPNAQLNYGYAILRSVVARAIVSSGMLPSFGIFHRNKYNAFCLADDIMEPYRPYVDWIVLHLEGINENEDGLTREHKIELLKIPQIDVEINGLKRPLFHAVSITTASLYKCYSGESRKISYPTFS
jgi:CRISPR-associated protein Cas1